MNTELNKKAFDQLSTIKNQCDSDGHIDFAGVPDSVEKILYDLLTQVGYGDVVELAKATSKAAIDAIGRAEDRSLPK